MSFIASGVAASVAAAAGLGTSALAIGSTAALLSAGAGAAIGAAGSAITGGDPGQGAMFGAASGALGGALGGIGAAGAGTGVAGGLSAGSSAATQAAITPALSSAGTSIAPSLLGSSAANAITPTLSSLSAAGSTATPTLLGSTGSLASINAITPSLANAPAVVSAGINEMSSISPSLFDSVSSLYSNYGKGKTLMGLGKQQEQQAPAPAVVRPLPNTDDIPTFSQITKDNGLQSNLSNYQIPTSILSPSLPSSGLLNQLPYSPLATSTPKMNQLEEVAKPAGLLSDDEQKSLYHLGDTFKQLSPQPKQAPMARSVTPQQFDANQTFMDVISKNRRSQQTMRGLLDNQVDLLNNRYFQ
jgi:hypothetical protein